MVWKFSSDDGGGVSTLSGFSDGTSSAAESERLLASPRRSTTDPRSMSSAKLFSAAASKRLSAKKSARLEAMTINKLRFSRLNGLYGRDQETKRLKESFERVVISSSSRISKDESPKEHGTISRQLVLVPGSPGVGKSAFARQLETPARKAGGFFVEGRFCKAGDCNDPYSAIAKACAGLCQEIINLQDLPSRDASFQVVSQKIEQELANDSDVLVSLVPQLASVLNHDLSKMSDKVQVATESRNRFHYAFQRFFRAVGSFGPIVLVVDDIQNADTESLALLDSLIGDKENTSLLLVCCYQTSDEISRDRVDVFTWIEGLDNKVSKQSLQVTKIPLYNLLLEDTSTMLADLLDTSLEKTQDLAKIVQRKTHGNIFFLKQFLESLVEQDLLEFNFGLMQWTWNEADIESATSATDNVVDLINAKMRGLPESLRYILPLAACLGSSFSEELLQTVTEVHDAKNLCKSDESTDDKSEDTISLSSWVQVAVAKGIIEPLDVDSYRFLHDRIQEAALSLIPVEDLSQTRFHVGEVLAEIGKQSDDLKVDIFVVANLLNEGVRAGLLSTDRRLETAQMNLEAGKQSIKSASFHQAAHYFQNAISLLPEDHWATLFDLSLELFSSAAEVENCIGDVAGLEDHCQAVISQDCPYEDKFRAYLVLIDSYGHRGLAEKAIELILMVLLRVGCPIPKRAHTFHTIVGLMGAKGAVKKLAPENISHLAKMDDSKKIKSMILLDRLCRMAYFCKKEYIPLAILKSLRRTLRYGLSEYSPPVFATVGILVGIMGDFQGGSMYANYAMSMLDHHGFRQVESRTIFCSYALVLHWTLPVHFIMKHLLRGYEAGMESGDVEHAIYNIMSYIEFGLYSGRSLVSTVEDYEFYYELIQNQKANNADLINCIRHILLELIESSETPAEEKVDKNEGERFVARTLEKSEPIMQATLRRFQLQKASIWGNYEFGANLAVEYGEEFPSQVPGHNGVVMVRIHAASCCFAMARKTRKKKYLNCAMKNRAVIKSWVRKGNPNVAHHAQFLDAELAACKGRPYEAKLAYEAGVLLAARNGFVHDQAMINERFGEYVLSEMNDTTEGKYRIIEALKLYDEWGAAGKVEQLVKKHQALLEDHPEFPEEINVGSQ